MLCFLPRLPILTVDWRMHINKKSISVFVLVVLGIYFLVFHTPPFPFSHEAIGLPPFHLVHAIFGAILLVGAYVVWNKK